MATPEQLYEASQRLTADHLHAAITGIDAELGEGYARSNPTLAAAYMLTAALDFGVVTLAEQIRASRDAAK